MFPIRDSIRSRTVPVVTRTLIVLNVIVFFYELLVGKDGLEDLFYLFGVVPARLTHPGWAAHVGFPGGAFLTLLTYQFLHGGWLHIIANMWALWIFGDNVEDAMGHFRYLVFYIFCGVVAALTQTFVQSGSTVPSVGASGAIAGVLGAYLIFYPTAWVEVVFPIFFFPFFFELPAVLYLGFWFLMQVFSGTQSLARRGDASGIAFWAHVGGFVAGMMLCQVFKRKGRPRRDEFWAG
jgi:membrane associated rhomboid family serine protease